MPAKSKQQLQLMFAIKNGAKVKGGPSKKVADEIIAKTSSKEKSKLMKR